MPDIQSVTVPTPGPGKAVLVLLSENRSAASEFDASDLERPLVMRSILDAAVEGLSSET